MPITALLKVLHHTRVRSLNLKRNYNHEQQHTNEPELLRGNSG
jgi:hypothetical protein